MLWYYQESLGRIINVTLATCVYLLFLLKEYKQNHHLSNNNYLLLIPTSMKSLLINTNNATSAIVVVFFSVIFITSFVASQAQGSGGDDSDSACVAPVSGCINGMFKQSTCTCQCIPPFCPLDGNCLATELSCEDPWVDCELGVDCPWWVNYLTTEECTTGSKV